MYIYLCIYIFTLYIYVYIYKWIGLQALSSRNDEPERASRPWDKAFSSHTWHGCGARPVTALSWARGLGYSAWRQQFDRQLGSSFHRTSIRLDTSGPDSSRCESKGAMASWLPLGLRGRRVRLHECEAMDLSALLGQRPAYFHDAFSEAMSV